MQDNPHRLAATSPQEGGLQLRKKPGQLLTREQLKAQKVPLHRLLSEDPQRRSILLHVVILYYSLNCSDIVIDLVLAQALP